MAATGALTGLAANPGDKLGEISPIQPLDRTVNGIIGGATGYALSKVLPGAKNALDDVATAPLGPKAAPNVAASSPIGEAAEKEVFDPFTKQMVTRSGAVPDGSARSLGMRIDPFTKEVSSVAPIADDIAASPASGPSLITRGMQGVQNLGAKGNEILDQFTPGSDNPLIKSLGRIGRYGVAGKVQAPLDALQHGPKAAQYLAGKAASGLDSAGDFLMKSPTFQSLAEKSPQAFSALAGDFGKRVNKDPKQEDEQQKQAFVQGN